MSDDLRAQFHPALVDIGIKHDAHLEEILHLAARVTGCGVKQSSQWAITPEGYRIEVEYTIDPDLPPYAVRGPSGTITQYALREEGDDT